MSKRLAELVRGRKSVAMLLDYDGTLREIEPDAAAAGPTPEVRRLLDALARARCVDVSIISGRTPQDLETFFDGYDFCLIAEHGAAIRRAGSNRWERLDDHVRYSWRDELLDLFRTYADSTPGSFVEVKRTSLVWHYRKADATEGEATATRLASELSLIAANRSLSVRHGKKIVEVTASAVSKRTAVLHLLNERLTPYDMVLVAGDDVTDESMFELDVVGLVSLKVGEGETKARYRLPTPVDLRRLLQDAVDAGP